MTDESELPMTLERFHEKPMKALVGTPEQQKAIAEWRAKLASSLAENLNANVTIQHR